MPVRPLNREQAWLLPPTLDELIPLDHPVRFVATFVDALDPIAWMELGMGLDGEPLGAPAYHPRALLSVWLYGFMSRVRSSRKLEAACRDQVPYLWLTGWQHPDHNTLWRFYQEHRQAMRCLFKRTVRTAVNVGLVDLAVQAVDGTKIAANADKYRTYDGEGLQRLLERTEAAIKEMEAQNEAGEKPSPPHLPEGLMQAEALRQRILTAMERLEAEERKNINLTDGEARVMKGQEGYLVGYNAQVMVSPLDGERAKGSGLLITAAEVVPLATDVAQLVPMMEQAEEMTGERVERTLADAGYHSGANLEACAQRGQEVVMPEAQEQALKAPYHKDRFSYDALTDSYTCPEGQVLRFTCLNKTRGTLMRLYQASGSVCRSCLAFGVCTKDGRHGRRLKVGPHEAAIRRHREWMKTEEAKAAYRQRKELPEPAFGVLKEQLGVRQFLLRGLAKVRAEWILLATAFNLRTLWRVWQQWSPERRSMLTVAARGC